MKSLRLLFETHQAAYEVAFMLGYEYDGCKEDRIRFCGIDAPEVSHADKAGQSVGEESREMVRSLIRAAGNQVIISLAKRDPCGIYGAARYGRLVAGIFVSAGKGTEKEKLLNYELVKAGMAYHYAKYRTHLRTQEVAASRFSISLTKQRLILVSA